MNTNTYHVKLHTDLADTSGIIVPTGHDAASYFELLRKSVREHIVEPTVITAAVREPGFLNRELGSIVSGYLLAKRDYRWLVFEPHEETYYCFWGVDASDLGAFGVCGNALYCWWD